MRIKIGDNSGMILVLTLVMIAVFLSIALSFSVLIISDINKARLIDNSVVAYYAADSGIEESLYLFRKNSVTSTKQLRGIRVDDQELDQSKASWNIDQSADHEEYFLRQRLSRGQSSKFFILNRTEDSGFYVKSISLEWYRGETEGNNASLQVSLTQLKLQKKEEEDYLAFYTDKSQIEISDTLSMIDPVCYDLSDLDINNDPHEPPVDYLVEIKVLGSNNSDDIVDRLTVKAYNTSCGTGPDDYLNSFNSKGISNLTVKSVGSFGRATQVLTAHLPPRDLPSSLVGFVLFSDEDITKAGGLTD
jgi:hypothetical protein